MGDSNNKSYYQRKIEETTDKIKENNPNLQRILTQKEYELFSELCDHISDKHSCTEAMDIIYTRMTVLLKQSIFSNIKFANVCAMVNELGGRPFGALYECYQINSIDHEKETIQIESAIESFRIYSKNIDLISEELYDIQQQSNNPVTAYLYHLSELFGYFFYQHMESIVSDEQYIHINNSYKQILDSIIELQTYNPSLQNILNSPSGTQLMTTIFSQEYLSDKNVNHWQSIYLMLGYVYLSLSWQSFDQYIRLVDQIISDEELGIEETKYGYEDIIEQAKLSLINLRDIYKSLQINQEYAEDVVYCIGKLHRFIKDYQKTIITDLSEAYQTLQYG